ncbi:serine hydrolase domain-containing protein [Fructilactobacillus lindneri]|uniref:Serine hydrolase n=1 Tax=Fructilactobacillus lindneri TaxID=53444 RepID=A0AB33BJ01_9LACO|nr:serine hydrolase domain-containing protein [Fructilactobacillus lindneri]ANZ58381.1 serine hydrolase [Fructilactobacillus lindneri]ANZ59703.1 serine hydrolase [Fructilactobacillus lindneri]POG98515.1 serine hydrolase [Fructilactobacillus lindneri]POH03903.1 serine hydrolase [Fructilactobacillus lindneri]POH04854.1 serine hydrolase [Fructilactobacillus lindneri]
MTFENTKAIIERMIRETTIPGASFSFITGVNVEDHVEGYRSLKPQQEYLYPNQLYDVASMTKVMGTLPVIMQLLNQGKIGIDDPVTKYLPEWKHPKITIRHLLTHTSDIDGYIPNRDELNMNQLRSALLGLDVGDEYGKKMKYQDVNYIFLGWIAGVVTGLPIQPLINQMVLQPLGMIDSTFHPDARRTVPTTYDETTGMNRVGKVHDPKAQVLGSDCGSAGLFSSLRDMDHFAQWMLQLTPPGKVYSNDMFDAMYVDQTPMQDGSRSFGWRLDEYEGHPYIWQSGYTGVVMIIVRQKRSAFVFLSNRVHPDVNEHFMEERNEMMNTYLKEFF